MQILIVEDERKLAKLLCQGLTEEGHQVLVAHDGNKGLELARSPSIDVLVLDLTLPGMDGLKITQTLKNEGNPIPILMLTARDTEGDIIRGLNTGADDYLTKPFSFDVFLARVRAVSRRGPIPAPVTYQIGSLVINTATRVIRRRKRSVSLTNREYSLLELLARRSPRVLTRNAIIQAVWGFDAEVSENNVEAFVHLVRSKVERPGDSRLIHTVRGVGYVLRSDEP